MAHSKDRTRTGSKRGRRIIVIAAALIVVSTLVCLSAKPAYRAFRNYRIDRNLEESREASRTGDMIAARDKARSVLLARGQDIEALHIWTTSLAKTNDPRAHLAALQLFLSKGATDQYRLDALRIIALKAPHAIALGAFNNLSEEKKKDPLFRAAIVPLLVVRGESKRAEKGLKELLPSNGEMHPAVALELIRSLASVRREDREPGGESERKKRVREARDILANLIKTDAREQALEGLLILSEIPDGFNGGELIPDLENWMDRNPDATPLHHLAAIQISLDAKAQSSDAIFKSAIARFGAADPGIVGTWLLKNGQGDLALNLVAEPSLTRSDAFFVKLNVLLERRQYSEIERLLAKPPDAADMVEIEIIRAVVAGIRKDKSLSDAAWNRALEQAAYDTTQNRFIELAKIASRQNAYAASENAWVAAIRSGWGPLPLYRDLQNVYSTLALEDRSSDLLAIFRIQARYEPGDVGLMNNFLYLGLLHGLLLPDEATTKFEKLANDHPENSELNSGLMLAKLMEGKAAEALSLVPAVRSSKMIAPLMADALEGSALALTGNKDAGEEMLRRVEWKRFMRQERIIFRQLLVKVESSSLPLPKLDEVEPEADPNQVPAWKKALERLEQTRSGEMLPALPPPRMPDWDKPHSSDPARIDK